MFKYNKKEILLTLVILLTLITLSTVTLYVILNDKIEVSLDESIFSNEMSGGILGLNLGSKESEVLKSYDDWDYEKSKHDVIDFDIEGDMYVFSGNLTESGYPVEITVRVGNGEVYMISEYYTTMEGKELESRMEELNRLYGECVEEDFESDFLVSCDWNSKKVLMRMNISENKDMKRYHEELTWMYKNLQ